MFAERPCAGSPVRVAAPPMRGLVPDIVGGGAMMHGARPSSRSLRALGLRKVTLLVPEHRAEALRQLARELCAQHRGPTASAIPQWRKLSPSVELLVDPGCGARCAVRDTRA